MKGENQERLYSIIKYTSKMRSFLRREPGKVSQETLQDTHELITKTASNGMELSHGATEVYHS